MRSDERPQPLLDVKGLHVAFGGKEVVHGIDFQIAAGEKLALVGESGSGKTVTALSLLRLVQNADLSGVARLFGGERRQQPSPQGPRDLLSIPERELRGIRGKEIAMIFQEPMTALNALYSVGDQIARCSSCTRGCRPAPRRRPPCSCWPTRAFPSRRGGPGRFRTSSRAASASAR